MAKTTKTQATETKTPARDSLGRPKAPKAPKAEKAPEAKPMATKEPKLGQAGEKVTLPGGSTIERAKPEPKPAAKPAPVLEVGPVQNPTRKATKQEAEAAAAIAKATGLGTKGRRLVVEEVPVEAPAPKKNRNAKEPAAPKAPKAPKAEKAPRAPRSSNLPETYRGVAIPRNLYQLSVEELQNLAEAITGKRPGSTKAGYLAHLISGIVREYRPAGQAAKGLRLALSPELTAILDSTATATGLSATELATELLAAGLTSKAAVKAAKATITTRK